MHRNYATCLIFSACGSCGDHCSISALVYDYQCAGKRGDPGRSEAEL